jgi:hypothetical protein
MASRHISPNVQRARGGAFGSIWSLDSRGDFTVTFSAVDRYAAQQAGVDPYFTFYATTSMGNVTPVVVRVPYPSEEFGV